MTTEGRSAQDERAAEGFGATSRSKVFLLYGGLIAVAVVVLELMLATGRHLHAPKAEGGGGQSQATEQVFWKLLLAILVIIVVSRAVGGLFKKFNQPQVVGEIAA